MIDLLREKQKTRLTILQKIYELSGGDVSKYINGGELATSCSIADESDFKKAVDYLEGEFLIEAKKVYGGTPALVRIKHAGIVEVESATLTPDKPTPHFMPMNVLYVNNMVGSAIQQGTVNSTQTSSIKVQANAIEELKTFIETATAELKKVCVETPLWQEVKFDIETLKAQSGSPNPKSSIIKSCLESVGRLCEGATAGAIGNHLATLIPPLLLLFG